MSGIDVDRLNAAFLKIDTHGQDIAQLKTDVKLVEQRAIRNEIDLSSMCQQLIKTETKVMDAVLRVEDKQDKLVAQENKREGAKAAVKVMYGCIAFAFLLMQFVTMAKTFSITDNPPIPVAQSNKIAPH